MSKRTSDPLAAKHKSLVPTSPFNMTAKFPHNTPSLMGGVPTCPNEVGGMASTRAVAAKMETAAWSGG